MILNSARATPYLEKIFSVKNVADHFGVSPSTVHIWIKNKELESVKFGRTNGIPERALKTFKNSMSLNE